MALDDLFKSLQMFTQGVKEFQLQSAIGDANKYVQDVKAADMSEQQKRSELQSLSNQLVGHLAGLNASPTQIASVAQAVGPKEYKNSAEMFTDAALTGNKELQKTAKSVMEAELAAPKALKEMEFAQQNQMQDKKFAQALMLAQMKGQSKPQKPEDIAFTSNLGVARSMIKDLQKAVGRSGTYESRFGNTDDAATLQGTPYQLAITYAKIVDPNSVARESEVEAAQKFLFPLGPVTSKEVTLKQLKRLQTILNRYEKERAAAKGGTIRSPLTGAAIDTASKGGSAPAADSGEDNDDISSWIF